MGEDLRVKWSLRKFHTTPVDWTRPIAAGGPRIGFQSARSPRNAGPIASGSVLHLRRSKRLGPPGSAGVWACRPRPARRSCAGPAPRAWPPLPRHRRWVMRSCTPRWTTILGWLTPRSWPTNGPSPTPAKTHAAKPYQGFLHTYNHHRHHSAIGGPPADRVPNLSEQST